MFGKNLGQPKGNTESSSLNGNGFDNILRTLTMLEKALERLLRQNYHQRCQYPPIVLEIEEAFNNLRAWIQDYKIYVCLRGYDLLLSVIIKELGDITGILITESKPVAGKKAIKKNKKNNSAGAFANQLTVCWNILGSIWGRAKGMILLWLMRLRELCRMPLQSIISKSIPGGYDFLFLNED